MHIMIFTWILISIIGFSVVFKKLRSLSKSNAILGQKYDKLCNVLAGELNVEDVKKKLEGREHKGSLEEGFSLTSNQVKKLRLVGKSRIHDDKGNYLFGNMKKSFLPHTVIGAKGYKGLWYLDHNLKVWEILDYKGFDSITAVNLRDNLEIYVAIDFLEVQDLIKNA